MPLRLTRFEFDQLAKRKTIAPRKRLDGKRWELEFAAQLDNAGLAYEREYRFKLDRRFRFDFAFLEEQIAVEIDGVVHRIKSRFNADREKGTIALLLGWRVLHVTSAQVRSGEALTLLSKLLCQFPQV